MTTPWNFSISACVFELNALFRMHNSLGTMWCRIVVQFQYTAKDFQLEGVGLSQCFCGKQYEVDGMAAAIESALALWGGGKTPLMRLDGKDLHRKAPGNGKRDLRIQSAHVITPHLQG